MKLVRYAHDELSSYGVIESGHILHLDGDPMGDCSKGSVVGKLGEVKLLAPCLPSKIIAIAINFKGIDGFNEKMIEPMVFIKPSSSICGPGDTISNPFPHLPMWGEAELGVVIQDIKPFSTEDEVKKGVLGFTIANDVTVENIEDRDHHLARSKCPDNFCPIGPWIDTDFDSTDCLIEAVQNDEVVRRGRSSEQFWQWPKIISWLSGWMTLYPWDIVITGNPPDIGGLRLLSDGDKFTAQIEGLGELTNRILIKGK
jgi:2-keto-4-pentenoate hydratase/2-oxohepta-3-ene-1,7-dioic acid hydratase in catechol pathway